MSRDLLIIHIQFKGIKFDARIYCIVEDFFAGNKLVHCFLVGIISISSLKFPKNQTKDLGSPFPRHGLVPVYVPDFKRWVSKNITWKGSKQKNGCLVNHVPEIGCDGGRNEPCVSCFRLSIFGHVSILGWVTVLGLRNAGRWPKSCWDGCSRRVVLGCRSCPKISFLLGNFMEEISCNILFGEEFHLQMSLFSCFVPIILLMVNGSEFLQQFFRLVVYPFFYRVLAPSQVVQISSIKSSLGYSIQLKKTGIFHISDGSCGSSW